MKNKLIIFSCLVILLPFLGLSQNNTFSPYSRYGIGEIAPSTLAHNSGMGGAYIALKPDSTMPNFLNTGNPASYALIKLTSLEVGGSYIYSKFTGTQSSLKKWSANFAYGTLGFPIRSNGGACFGIMPYSNVGYDSQNNGNQEGVGSITYQYRGSGGLNKAFVGYGIMPFKSRLTKFRRRNLAVPDSLRRLSKAEFNAGNFFSKMLSDFSLGVNVNYIFGNIQNETNVSYPNALLYSNTYVGDYVSVGAVTGNFGAQSAITIDSVIDKKRRKDVIAREVEEFKKMGFSGAALDLKRDSVERYTGKYHRALVQRVKITLGYFMGLNNSLNATHSSVVYNYGLDGTGAAINQDTIINHNNLPGTVKLPLEQGFGIGIKKGERINAVADFAITNWQNFKFFDNLSDFKKNYRVAVGVNFVPEKYAAGNGAFFKRVNYRLGASYQTGYINIRNTVVSDMSVTAGVGLPVGIGRLSSMVNISGQYGQMGTVTNGLLKQNYFRVNFGFTFSDRWFQKFRYD